MAAPTGYSRSQIVLHWLVFLLLVPQYVLHDAIAHGWHRMLRGETVATSPLIALHIVGGVLILALIIWRLVLRVRRGAPELPEGGSPMQDLLARVVHGLLYLLLLAMPVLGLIAWFGGGRLAGELHEVLKLPLLALMALHFFGALYHQFVLKDGLLARMKRAG